MAKTKTIRNTNLAFQQGGSDKYYDVFLEELLDGSGYLVNCEYARRGAAPNHATKTKAPVDLAKATKLFEKTVNDKLKKGYQVVGTTDSAAPAAPVAKPKQQDSAERLGATNDYPVQLLNAVTLSELRHKASLGGFMLQVKHDGVRCPMIAKGRLTEFFNRKNQAVPVAEKFRRGIVDLMEAMNWNSMSVDGEMLGDHYVIFDVFSANGTDMRTRPFRDRNEALRLISKYSGGLIRVDVAVDAETNLETYLKQLRNEEGMVLKAADAPYSAGRPNSGGDQFKFKFVESATVKVSKVHDDRRSAEMLMLKDNKEWVVMGNVTIPPNASLPEAGSLIEVRYLYAYPNGGKLFQPVYSMPREDVGEEACDYGKLKFKSESGVAEVVLEARKPSKLALNW